MMLIWIKNLLENKWLAWITTTIIFILCTIPSQEITKHTDLNDKTAHFIAFGAWAFLWFSSYKKLTSTLLIGCLYGILIECWQYILPESFHRGFDVLDMIADAIGVVLGVILGFVIREIMKF